MLARAWRWVCEQVAFLLVLAGIAASFGYLIGAPRHPVRGSEAISIVVLAAALLRLTLPTSTVGMLAIRNRWVDTFCYLVLGGLILATDIRLRR